MNQVSNVKVVEKPVLKNVDVSFIDYDNFNSKARELYYLSLGRLDLANLRLVFLEKFDDVIEFSENKERDYKLFENINYYFDFIDDNLVVYTESMYRQLSALIDVTYVLMENAIELKSFYRFYESYMSLRRSINKFKLSKKIYKERRIC